MIAAFLLPFPFRGYRAPYLWVYYRLLSSIDEEILFILGKDYLTEPEHWKRQGRWEMKAQSQARLGFRIPAPTAVSGHRYRFLADELFTLLMSEAGDNPIAAFRRLLTERIHFLEEAFERVFSESETDEVEAILTWCNCPSLNEVAAARGIPVMHLEMGPLRWPSYRPTAYLDFSGVNGNTEAEARYQQSGFDIGDWSRAALWDFFYTGDSMPERSNQYDLGVALQVEDDSNLVAFGHGFDNQALLAHVLLRYPEDKALVRAHPGSLFGLKENSYRVDASADSIAFIRQCKRILTVNSSVGLEAVLSQIPVKVLGDCSYRFVVEATDEAEQLSRLAFYLFAYLVPQDLIYDPAYLRFRLNKPAEAEIMERHFVAYGARPGTFPATP
ncbi:MAG: hypothetical protein COS39_04705 [Hydrogenophilales bacterium CG03_land_8_20_14_0_80_62_28]|nr:MAG: hypothetical protein AUJ86_06755 [Hydrogenophilaceae bacterium CG1_02_62_390]PIV23322.1 MAG: hypothetical protein COS39_04705 [Hydrogenophilales bacterium CG03_land_8_20_14_0_80_62_28]PIW38734.1 MAG: hypothetical protein COW23_05105 [Hydrogenophilales bacterium CG15_BIG_FIL_POST_REV_8_21_14_020_62_31]PIW72550.1 MAG: hypothetical protein COW07_02405 [Hydrogenophilales bacterium CG12_big_fil_rev_8_21_14_0_65_61_21]PIY98944.1 MAG: hypothetical protein COY64_03420 [Hydrogenophilales bacteri